MKKFAVMFMMLLYGVTGTGFAMNLHFCSGTIAAVEINGPPPACSPTGEKMKGCTDKKVEVKVKDAHQTETVSSKAPGIFSFDLPGLSLSDLVPAAHMALFEKLFDKNPPPPQPPQKVEPFLKNRNLRI